MTDLDKMARELLAGCLDDWGCPQEARNVRTGEDIESYEVELRLILKLHSYGLLRFAGEPLPAPPGYVLVPVEPTPLMIATFRADNEHGSLSWSTHTTLRCADFGSRYAGMIAAAPEVK